MAACSSSASDGGATKSTAPTTTASPRSTTITYQKPGLAKKVVGPISGGKYGIPYLAMPKGMADENGYTEQEYFLSGTAHAYDVANSTSEDGTWTATPNPDGAAYKTRIVVRRPKDDADFSGTVVVAVLAACVKM